VRLRKDGTAFPVSLTISPILGSDGGIVGASKIARDMTSQRRAEDQFRRIFDESPIGMALADADTYHFVQVNTAFCHMLGYSAEELIGRSRDEFTVPEDRGMPLPVGPGTQATWHPTDKRYVTKSGAIVHARVRIMDLGALASGERVVLGIADDVTQYRQTEEQLRQAQKMEAIGNLTGGMAHDFNNLLAIIVGNLELALDRTVADVETHELVAEAFDAAWHGADLTQRLLAFARRQPLRPVRIDLNELVRDTVKLLGRLLDEDIEISLHLEADIWPIAADPAQLEACLANLATNARDAMPKGGRLIIRTANRHLGKDYVPVHPGAIEGEFGMIEVSDTGTGMPAGTLAHIFEPFFTTKEQGKGTGLGLSMVFGFLKQSGGHVSVYSELGLGTTFRLYLPRAAEAMPASEVQPESAAVRGGAETILVVEDNAGVRHIVVRLLRDLGYRVLESDCAAAALEQLALGQADLLLTDIIMPGGLNGAELARMARERWPALKVVLTSGFPQGRVKGDDQFAAGYELLTKPYSKEELATVLRAALDGSPS
jgi:PAS domain S-box-containing protein